MAWEIIVRPEKSWVGLINSMGSESIILIINALMVRVSMPSTGEEELENLGLAIVALMITCCVWNYGCWLIYIIMGIYGKFKKASEATTQNGKKMDEYFPSVSEAKVNEEKYKTELKSFATISQGMSTIQIFDKSQDSHNGSFEKGQPPEVMSAIEEFKEEDIKDNQLKPAEANMQAQRKVSSAEGMREAVPKNKRGKKGSKAKTNRAKTIKEDKKVAEARIKVIQPTSFFKEEPSPAKGELNSSPTFKDVDLNDV